MCAPAASQRLKDFASEVQGQQWGLATRAAFAREDGLIAFAVFVGIRAADVGWQRHVAEPLHCSVDIVIAEEADRALPSFAMPGDLG